MYWLGFWSLVINFQDEDVRYSGDKAPDTDSDTSNRNFCVIKGESLCKSLLAKWLATKIKDQTCTSSTIIGWSCLTASMILINSKYIATVELEVDSILRCPNKCSHFSVADWLSFNRFFHRAMIDQICRRN